MIFPEKVKSLVPEILKDMNHTTNLMENLLEWSKSQMQTELVDPQLVDISEIIISVFKLLEPQAKAKNVSLCGEGDKPVYVYVDKNMVHMVLRNLVSNAIKFTGSKTDRLT